MSKVGKTKTKRADKGKFKGDPVIGLLSRPSGAAIGEMINAMDWQAHSDRGFMAGIILGGCRRYHIVEAVASK